MIGASTMQSGSETLHGRYARTAEICKAESRMTEADAVGGERQQQNSSQDTTSLSHKLTRECALAGRVCFCKSSTEFAVSQQALCRVRQ